MVNRLAGLVVLAAAAWGAVVLFLCGVQLAGETVAWVANGGFGRLPGWAWPLIAAGLLGVVGVAWFRWVWPDEAGEERDRRGEELGAAAGGIGRVCPRCEADPAPVGCGGVVGNPPGVGWGTGPHGVAGGGRLVILPPGHKIVPVEAAEEGQEQGDNTARACDEAALRAAVAKDRVNTARCVGKESPYIDGRGGA